MSVTIARSRSTTASALFSLQRGPRRPRVVSDGDVLGLEVLRRGGARSGEVHTTGPEHRLLPHECAEVRRAHRGGGDVRDVDDADRSLGIDGMVVARLALVRDHHVAAVRREGEHVGQRADGHPAERRERRGPEEEHGAGHRLVGGLHGHGDDTITRRHAVRRTAAEALGADGGDAARRGRVAQVEHVEAAERAVDHEQVPAAGVEGRDLGGGSTAAAVEAADRGQADAGGAGRGLVGRGRRIAALPQRIGGARGEREDGDDRECTKGEDAEQTRS
jgi:hypothetical protein